MRIVDTNSNRCAACGKPLNQDEEVLCEDCLELDSDLLDEDARYNNHDHSEEDDDDAYDELPEQGENE